MLSINLILFINKLNIIKLITKLTISFFFPSFSHPITRFSKYTEITSTEQFRKYKQDFNCEYEEYKKLHNIVDRNANKFALLEQELRQAQEGTETWNVSIKYVCTNYV